MSDIVPTPNPIQRHHKRLVKTFTIISRIFLPVSIVFLAISVILLAVNIPMLINAIATMEASGSCVQTSAGVHCDGPGTPEFVLSVIGLSGSATLFSFGLPMLIVAIVFHNVARSRRAEDEAKGIDYSDCPYGK